MKGKILTFIIGLLVGAIIATGGFLIYQNNNKHQGPEKMNGERPRMMQQDGNSTDGNTPPSLPNGEQPNGEIQTQNSTDSTNTTNS